MLKLNRFKITLNLKYRIKFLPKFKLNEMLKDKIKEKNYGFVVWSLTQLSNFVICQYINNYFE